MTRTKKWPGERANAPEPWLSAIPTEGKPMNGNTTTTAPKPRQADANEMRQRICNLVIPVSDVAFMAKIAHRLFEEATSHKQILGTEHVCILGVEEVQLLEWAAEHAAALAKAAENAVADADGAESYLWSGS